MKRIGEVVRLRHDLESPVSDDGRNKVENDRLLRACKNRSTHKVQYYEIQMFEEIIMFKVDDEVEVDQMIIL